MAPKPDKPPKPPKPPGKGKPGKVAKVAPKVAKAGETAGPAAFAAPPPLPGPRRGTLSQVADRLGGARLCYGDPVREGGRTIIPVARVRASGGFGWGNRGEPGEGDGAGGGGLVNAVPMGYIEVGPDGSRYEAIADPQARVRALRVAAATAVAVAGALAGLRARRDGRRGRRRLGRGG